MKTYEELQVKQNQMLTTIAEKLSEKIPQSEVYELIDDIIDIHDIVENQLGWQTDKVEDALILLENVGK